MLLVDVAADAAGVDRVGVVGVGALGFGAVGLEAAEPKEDLTLRVVRGVPGQRSTGGVTPNAHLGHRLPQLGLVRRTVGAVTDDARDAVLGLHGDCSRQDDILALGEDGLGGVALEAGLAAVGEVLDGLQSVTVSRCLPLVEGRVVEAGVA